uniref:Putative secreted protein n=1 Tax=Ixodes ricinus TaxID=34613 RepID=A0A6B0UYX4_IXORI
MVHALCNVMPLLFHGLQGHPLCKGLKFPHDWRQQTFQEHLFLLARKLARDDEHGRGLKEVELVVRRQQGGLGDTVLSGTQHQQVLQPLQDVLCEVQHVCLEALDEFGKEVGHSAPHSWALVPQATLVHECHENIRNHLRLLVEELFVTHHRLEKLQRHCGMAICAHAG